MKGLCYTPKEMMKLLTNKGWELSHYKSNHYTYKKHGCKKIITVPTHRSELSRPIVFKLLKQIHSY